jgi:hypothetical protein
LKQLFFTVTVTVTIIVIVKSLSSMSEIEDFRFGSFFDIIHKVGPGRDRLSVYIPDTVVVRNGVMINWFFTSKEDAHVVLKKNRDNVTVEGILESFCRKQYSFACPPHFSARE